MKETVLDLQSCSMHNDIQEISGTISDNFPDSVTVQTDFVQHPNVELAIY